MTSGERPARRQRPREAVRAAERLMQRPRQLSSTIRTSQRSAVRQTTPRSLPCSSRRVLEPQHRPAPGRSQPAEGRQTRQAVEAARGCRPPQDRTRRRSPLKRPRRPSPEVPREARLQREARRRCRRWTRPSSASAPTCRTASRRARCSPSTLEPTIRPPPRLVCKVYMREGEREQTCVEASDPLEQGRKEVQRNRECDTC